MAKGTKNATRRAILRARRAQRVRSAATNSQTQGQHSTDGNAGEPVACPSPASSTSLQPALARTQKALHRQVRQVKDVRRLKSSVKHWTSVLKDYKRCKVKVAEAMQQLVEAKKQISDLNRAMNFLLKQPPNNGHLFDERWGMWVQWTKMA